MLYGFVADQTDGLLNEFKSTNDNVQVTANNSNYSLMTIANTGIRRSSFFSNLFSSSRGGCNDIRTNIDKTNNTNTSSTDNSNDNLNSPTTSLDTANHIYANDESSKISGASALPIMLCGLLPKELLTQQQFSQFQIPFTDHINQYSEQYRKKCTMCAYPKFQILSFPTRKIL